MALPVKQAADLAKSMASKGLSGSISMGEPDYSEEDAPEEGASELQACVKDAAEAIASGDVAHIERCLMDLVDCIKHEDEEQDQEMEA